MFSEEFIRGDIAVGEFAADQAKVKIQGSADLYIGSIYRPPDKGDQEYLQHLHSRITRIPTDKGAHLWIGGDFNLPDIDWDEENVKPYASNSSVCNQLLTIAKNAYLDQIVTQPTRITETTYIGAFLHNKCYTYKQGRNNTRHIRP